MSIGFPWYIVEGDINLDNFNKFKTEDRGFIWRGYTYNYQMIPSAANYNQYNECTTEERTNNCYPLTEIKRISQKIYELNKLQRFPFEIPLIIRRILFSSFYQPEDKVFNEMNITEFPDSSLVQSMSIVQHEFGGTSLLDFSTNKYKALYFAIGKKEMYSKDSYIFGLNVPYFETNKNNRMEDIFSKYKDTFDLIYPSYYKNKRIAHQEGMFLYQKFIISKNCNSEKKYENIIEYFSERFNEDKSNGQKLFEKISIDKFLEKTEKEGDKPIFYILLKIPAKEKELLKTFLNTIGITDNFMMN